MFHTTDAAKAFLLGEGTDMKCGARHLTRAIERLPMHPLSNLVATEQISASDLIELDYDDKGGQLRFSKIGNGLALQSTTSQVTDKEVPTYASTAKAAYFV